jgi:hypothetical protein
MPIMQVITKLCQLAKIFQIGSTEFAPTSKNAPIKEALLKRPL